MPDLVGLPSQIASRRIGQLEGRARLGLSSSWEGGPVILRCGIRPHTVVSQLPAAGTPLKRRTVIRIRTANFDVTAFRGPCEPTGGELGPVKGSDAAIARAFYWFAADPSLGAPFAEASIWVGIEDRPDALSLGHTELTDLSAWELHTPYAERSGPFSALDLLASSGGHYEVHEGIRGCFTSNRTPAPLAGTRAITLTAPRDAFGACSQWWGVTLFLDEADQIHGVSLRLGSP